MQYVQADNINSIFNKEFNFNIEKFNSLRKIKYYQKNLFDFSLNYDLRDSVKFHRTAGEFVMKELLNRTNKKIKNFLSEPIVLGASVSPSDFDENGEVYYVSMASVKNFKVELDESQKLSPSYAKLSKNQTKYLKKGDIIMTRSGAAIGKFAIVENDINAIFADFTMRIRLKNYNSKFAYYYFRSTYFQYLIEIYKKGKQNQNIFPIQVREFPLLDITLERQNEIVEEIDNLIEAQNSLEKDINKQRAAIDKLILSCCPFNTL